MFSQISLENRRIITGTIFFLIAAALLIQFWPGARDFSNPPVVSEPEWDSPYTRQLAQRACYDCHSNETEWPWYNQIVPISSLILRDVRRGREVLNFSDWENTCCTEAGIEEMAELVGKYQMPLPYYEVIHPESVLSDKERGELIYGLIRTMRSAIAEGNGE